MAHHRQVIKRYRQSLKNHARNVFAKSSLKTASAKLLTLAKEKKKIEVEKALAVVYSLIDKAVKYGVLHKNNAARRKSRITHAVHELAAK